MTSDINYIIKPEIRIGEDIFETVIKFTYLGTMIQMDNNKIHGIHVENIQVCYLGLL